jgi:NADH-quinone oxidoreductase subunit N
MQFFFFFAAFGSIFVGTLGAYYQVRIKRFLAYTSITQAGYILLGVGCGSLNGFACALLHLLMYTSLSICFFSIILNTNNILDKKNAVYFNEFITLHIYNPKISYCLCLVLMGMASLPPIGSFFSKFYIYSSLVESKLELLVLFSLGLNLISTFYYLRFIQDIFFFNFEGKALSSLTNVYYFDSNKILYSILFFNLLFLFLFILIPSFVLSNIFNAIFSCAWPFFYF